MSTTEAERSTTTFGNWHRPSSRGLAGMQRGGTLLLFASLMLMVLLTAAFGFWGSMAGLAVAGIGILLVYKRDKHGFTIAAKMGERMGWLNARRHKRHLHRGGLVTRWGSNDYRLPGVMSKSRLHEVEDGFGRRVAVVAVPRVETYTIVFEASPDGSALIEAETMDDLVANWGSWLASAGEDGEVLQVSVTVESAPESGLSLRAQIASRVDERAPQFAKDVMSDVLDSLGDEATSERCFIAVCFSGRGRPRDRVLADIAARLPGMSGALESTGAGSVRPMTAMELSEVVRTAYDPGVAITFDEARLGGDALELRWDEVGPAADQSMWDHYRHDSAVSVSWAMTEAPRGNVRSSILKRFLEPHVDIARKRVTLLYRPIEPGRAAAIVVNDVDATAYNMSSGIGRRREAPSARQKRESRAAEARENEEAEGAGLVNFGLIATATVASPEDLAAATAAMDSLAPSARLRLRPMYGAQQAGFTAGLPLGLNLRQHTAIPEEIKERVQ